MTERFEGFPEPKENWSKLPHSFIAALPSINSLAELKCILYVLRHTWGYKEYRRGKRITSDEFMNGRKKKDGTRIDKGTGLARSSIVEGLKSAVEHGFLIVHVDDRDKARVEKYYSLNMRGVRNSDIQRRKPDIGQQESGQRTGKDTPEINQGEEHPAAIFWRENMKMMLTSLKELEEFKYLMETYPKQRLINAMEISKGRGKYSVAYVRGILHSEDSEAAVKPAPTKDRYRSV